MGTSGAGMARGRKSRSIKTKLEKMGDRLRDPGPDASGRFPPNPFDSQHGHIYADAPQELQASKHSKFLKRKESENIIGYYCHLKLINEKQKRAAYRLQAQYRAYRKAPRVTASYEPDQIKGSGSPDGNMVGHGDAVAEFVTTMSKCSQMGYGVLMHVVLIGESASSWAELKGHSTRVSGAVGLAFLRAALDELVAYFGY